MFVAYKCREGSDEWGSFHACSFALDEKRRIVAYSFE
jgi:hypothetical protein